MKQFVKYLAQHNAVRRLKFAVVRNRGLVTILNLHNIIRNRTSPDNDVRFFESVCAYISENFEVCLFRDLASIDYGKRPRAIAFGR